MSVRDGGGPATPVQTRAHLRLDACSSAKRRRGVNLRNHILGSAGVSPAVFGVAPKTSFL